MDPLTAGVVAGGLSLIGTHATNQASSAQAARQMAFQQDMSDTAHQREVADLRKAGLNPILSALGAGASTPSGAQGSMNDLGAGISKGAETAIAVRAQNKELEHKDADIDLKHDQGSNLAAERVNLTKDTQLKNQYVAQEALKTKILSKTADAAIKKARAEGNWAEVNQLMGVINSGASSANQILNPFNKIFPGKK